MISIDPKLSKPIFLQIVDGLKENIIKNILSPGDRIPSVRELSMQLEINPNTISKSYKELERQKIIETIQGRGTFISKNLKPIRDKEKFLEICESLKKLIIDSKYIGVNEIEFIKAVKDIYKSFGGEII
ncbi:MAG: GntR family transcriptional regulator [Clostridiales bacterium]